MTFSMITRILRLFVLVSATMSLTNCAMTGDPRHGGIFWSEQKAQGRQHELREDLVWESHQTNVMQSRGTDLQGHVGDIRSDNSRWQRHVNAVEGQNTSLMNSVADKNRELATIRAQQASLEARKAALEADRSLTTPPRESQVAELKIEIAKLKARASALSEGYSR